MPTDYIRKAYKLIHSKERLLPDMFRLTNALRSCIVEIQKSQTETPLLMKAGFCYLCLHLNFLQNRHLRVTEVTITEKYGIKITGKGMISVLNMTTVPVIQKLLVNDENTHLQNHNKILNDTQENVIH